MAATGLAAPALAAVLLPVSDTLGSGSAAVLSCGNLDNGVVRYAVTDGAVTEVTVTNLPGTCNGQQLRLALVGSDGTTSLGPTTITGGGVSLAIATNRPTSTSITEVRLAVTG